MERSDQELIALYRDGQVAALQELVEKYKRLLHGFIVKMTRGSDEPDEIFQEVWFKAISRLDRYREDNFPGWLVRIAHNLVIDRSRRRKPDVSLDASRGDALSMADMIPSKQRAPDSLAASRELAGRIGVAVEQLPPKQREVFLMRLQADLPFKEIAKMQGVSINTALARMQYALTKLKTLLADDYRWMNGGAT
jgi:RNA polymerase sigma-70 factor (ECF subfamily)